MPSKSKKTKSTGRFGARYGKTVRVNVVSVEQKQKKKQKCPYCGKEGITRVSKGIWQCTRKKCSKKFASKTYYLE